MNIPEEEYVGESLLLPALADEELDDYDFRWQDIHATIIGMVPILVEKARNATKSSQSISYRGFLVGAAGIAYDSDPTSPRIGTFTAGNYKAKLREDQRSDADVEDIPKFCAEMDIAMRASIHDFERIGILVVAATTNPDRIRAVTELAGPTLEPCEECEHVMQHSDLIDDQTIILTVGSGDDICQVQNLASLASRYKSLRDGVSPKPLKKHPYSSYIWERRQREYIRNRNAENLPRGLSERNKREEQRCRELAYAAMTAYI